MTQRTCHTAYPCKPMVGSFESVQRSTSMPHCQLQQKVDNAMSIGTVTRASLQLTVLGSTGAVVTTAHAGCKDVTDRGRQCHQATVPCDTAASMALEHISTAQERQQITAGSPGAWHGTDHQHLADCSIKQQGRQHAGNQISGCLMPSSATCCAA